MGPKFLAFYLFKKKTNKTSQNNPKIHTCRAAKQKTCVLLVFMSIYSFCVHHKFRNLSFQQEISEYRINRYHRATLDFFQVHVLHI